MRENTMLINPEDMDKYVMTPVKNLAGDEVEVYMHRYSLNKQPEIAFNVLSALLIGIGDNGDILDDAKIVRVDIAHFAPWENKPDFTQWCPLIRVETNEGEMREQAYDMDLGEMVAPWFDTSDVCLECRTYKTKWDGNGHDSGDYERMHLWAPAGPNRVRMNSLHTGEGIQINEHLYLERVS
jgi:hypothetical protein